MAADGAKPTADMTIVVRDDGKKMWAEGKPLYNFKKDAVPDEDQRRRFPQWAYGEAMIR